MGCLQLMFGTSQVNVSDLGLVTTSGKVVWGKYAQVTNNPENDGCINALLLASGLLCKLPLVYRLCRYNRQQKRKICKVCHWLWLRVVYFDLDQMDCEVKCAHC